MRLKIRVYYEDTDSGGVVYYANYLRYFERGRTELLRERGVDLAKLQDEGLIFAVARADVRYLRPLRYADLFNLDTEVVDTSGATVTFEHRVCLTGSAEPCATGIVVVAAVGRGGRPVRVPAAVREALGPPAKRGGDEPRR